MKFPHCSFGIYEGFVESRIIQRPMETSEDGTFLAHAVAWNVAYQRCPVCHECIILLKRVIPTHQLVSFMAYPSSSSRPIPPQVVDPYRQDFSEACKVLSCNPKASAALSRRCLQTILRDKAGTTTQDLADQIEQVINATKVPVHIAEDLQTVPSIGNFAGYPMKNMTAGVVTDVEPGEAEWNLDVLESLFDFFFFVQPAAATKRKANLNKNLKDAGKRELP
jgi:hypothetical protein